MKTEEIIVDEILRDHFKIEKGIPTFIPDDVTPEEIIRLIIDYNKANKPLKQSEQRNPDGYVYLNPHHDNNYFYKQKPDNLAVQPVYFAPPVPASDLKELKDWDEVKREYYANAGEDTTAFQWLKQNYHFPVQRAEPDGWVYRKQFFKTRDEAFDETGEEDLKPVYFSPLPSVNEKEAVEWSRECKCPGSVAIINSNGRCGNCNGLPTIP